MIVATSRLHLVKVAVLQHRRRLRHLERVVLRLARERNPDRGREVVRRGREYRILRRAGVGVGRRLGADVDTLRQIAVLARAIDRRLDDHPPEALPRLVRRPLHRLVVSDRAGANADDPDRAGSRPAHVRIRVATDRARLVDELRADEGDILPVKVQGRAGARRGRRHVDDQLHFGRPAGL